MHLIIAGCGKMAEALFAFCQEFGIDHVPFDPHRFHIDRYVGRSVAVHLGSGRQLEKLHTYCANHSIPIIQGSTGQKLPDSLKTSIVDAPNLALPIVYMLGLIPDVHFRLESLGVPKCTVRESHQATKTSLPGTAVKFAEGVKLEKSDILSVRDPKTQRLLGVPEEHLGRHGYHWITWAFPDLEVEFVTKVKGLRPYAFGAATIARNLLAGLSTLENRLYPATSFI